MPGVVRRTAAFAVLLLSAVFAAPVLAASDTCASPPEAEALKVRILQNRLMVAALTCGEQERYNAFVGRHETLLAESGRIMADYFRRLYGGRGKQELNTYVTTLANRHSLESLDDRATFCRQSARTLERLLQAEEADVKALSKRLSLGEGAGRACP